MIRYGSMSLDASMACQVKSDICGPPRTSVPNAFPNPRALGWISTWVGAPGDEVGHMSRADCHARDHEGRGGILRECNPQQPRPGDRRPMSRRPDLQRVARG